MKTLHNKMGFTLIEMIIVMAIVMILGAVGYPAYGTWMKNAAFREKARGIASKLTANRATAVATNTENPDDMATIAMTSDATITLKRRNTDITDPTAACTLTTDAVIKFKPDGSASTPQVICVYDTASGRKRYEIVLQSTTTGRVFIR